MAIFRSMLGSTQASSPIPEAVQTAAISSADAKQFGLENFGNTCYINTILQALYFCQPFRDLVISTPDSSSKGNLPIDIAPPTAPKSSSPVPTKRRNSTALVTGNTAAVNGDLTLPTSPPTLFSALRSLFIYIAQNPNDKGKVSPTAFVNKVKAENEAFRNTNHQDAHEALNFILNKVMEELEAEEKSQTTNGKLNGATNNGKSRKTMIHDLFEGVLTSETRCLTCETVSSRDECFLDLSIDIEPHSSVTACLRQFSASEMLCQRNKFSCDSCSGLQEAEKRMKVKKLPNVLALHLKRFKYQEEAQKFIKLTYRVAFPFELRLFNTVDDAENADRLYELFAIVVHIGGGPHHGHYTTIIRSQASWYLYDDDNVECIKENEIPKYFGESSVGAGYVLFYQASDMKSEGALPVPEPRLHTSNPNGGSVISEENTAAKAPVSVSASQTAPESKILQHHDEFPPKAEPSGSNDDNPGKETLETRLRRPKSEKSIPAKLGFPFSERSPPPVPPVPGKRPKTGDGTLGISNIFKKRSQEPPSSFPPLPGTQTGGSQTPKSSHYRNLSSTESSRPVEQTQPNGKVAHPSTDPLPDLPHRPKRRPSTASPPIPPPKPAHFQVERGLPTSTPPTLPLPSPETRNSSGAKVPRPLSSQNSIPAPRITPSPENGSPHPAMPHVHNNLTDPIRKAVRKMSLSSMPIKFGALGRRERER